MKEPKVTATWSCDGMCCQRTLSHTLVSIESANPRDLGRIAEMAGWNFLGRNTIFCPDCVSGRRGRGTAGIEREGCDE